MLDFIRQEIQCCPHPQIQFAAQSKFMYLALR